MIELGIQVKTGDWRCIYGRGWQGTKDFRVDYQHKILYPSKERSLGRVRTAISCSGI